MFPLFGPHATLKLLAATLYEINSLTLWTLTDTPKPKLQGGTAAPSSTSPASQMNLA